MAFHNDSRLPFDSNAKGINTSFTEKNEQSTAASNKYANCLRIPEGTTWPKIPERRIHKNNVVNNAQAPYIITLIRKPQKSKNAQLHTQLITQQVNSTNPLKSNEITLSEKMQKEKIHAKNVINYNDKNSNEISTEQNRVNPPKQFNADDNYKDTSKLIATPNKEVNYVSEKIYNPNANFPQNYTDLKMSNDYQDSIGSNNNNELYSTNISRQRKENNTSNNKSSPLQKKKEFNNYQQMSKREWMAEKMRQTQSYLSETTDSEVSSSDTTENDQIKMILERQIQTSHKNLNCCNNKALKYPHIKKEAGLCSCSQHAKLRTSKKPAHHSEPQIESSFNSRQCSTAHGNGLHCCTKDFHRVASDSDCRAVMYKSEIPRRCKEQDYDQDHLRNFDDLINYQDTLEALRPRKSEETKQKEIGFKAQRAFQTNFFNGLKKMSKKKNNQEESNLRQIMQGAPQEKRRKCKSEVINSCDNDAIYILSSLDGRDANPNTSIATGSIPHDKRDSRHDNFETFHELSIKKNTSLINDNENNEQERIDANNHLLKLKRAVFLGSILYAFILSLPTLYEYFFYEEEYDSYEEQSYIEVILKYVVSSFQEAFSGFFDFISKVFFQSRACRKCH